MGLLSFVSNDYFLQVMTFLCAKNKLNFLQQIFSTSRSLGIKISSGIFYTVRITGSKMT